MTRLSNLRESVLGGWGIVGPGMGKLYLVEKSQTDWKGPKARLMGWETGFKGQREALPSASAVQSPDRDPQSR